MLKKSIIISIFSLCLLSVIEVKADNVNPTSTQDFLNFLSNYNFASSTPETTSIKTSEDVVYNKKNIVKNNTISTPIMPTEQKVYLDDILGVDITSKYSPETPIELFALTYKNNLTKKISIKFVYNEAMNVLKTYRLNLNQDLLDEIGDVDYFKVGFCVKVCKLIPVKMIISK